ncbi:MAG: glycosyltransferase family 2 protein [Lactobacillus sp.]|nr:glycosyltransferase family 2 protein [Lactobacillus sp.]
MPKILTLIVPCYNEEAVLPDSSGKLKKIMDELIAKEKISKHSQILFVNDGSTDKTWSIIQLLEDQDEIFSGIRLSRNFGHQNAVMAGLSKAVSFSDYMITIDCDLQDDENKIIEMIDKANAGKDIVFGVRNDRQSDTNFKRNTANGFYWLMNKMGIKLIPNHADFRLMTKRAVTAMLEYQEDNLFLRGIVTELGFETDYVYYKRKPRLAGESHYPFKKMVALALNGITSFTTVPLKLISYLGFAICLVSFLGLIIIHRDILGLSLWLLGGIQILTIGVVGLYISKIFTDVKKRPRFIIEDDEYSFKQRFQQKKIVLMKK